MRRLVLLSSLALVSACAEPLEDRQHVPPIGDTIGPGGPPPATGAPVDTFPADTTPPEVRERVPAP
jgi:hypothetical protein